MTEFAQLRISAGLTQEDVRNLLGLAEDRITAYECGELRPSAREMQTIRGLLLAKPKSEKTSITLDEDETNRSDGTPLEPSKTSRVAKRSRNSGDVTPVLRGNQTIPVRPKKNSRLHTALELCAGGGGAALGLEQAGFSPAALIEIDRHACATLRRNRPYWNVIEADVGRFDASYWQDVDLLSGGLLCPPFSIAGKQLGENDERDMFPAMLKIAKITRPRAILIENVRGILTEKFTPFRARIDRALDELGFDTYWMGFNAAQFGVPQVRFRAFLVALRRGATKPLEWPIPTDKRVPTVGAAIADLMGERGWPGVKAWAERASAPAPTIVGGSHKHGGPDLGPTRARREWAQLGVDGLGLADEAPSHDFKGMPRLTIPMVARLQSFPDEWQFVGSKTHAYRQVGNALPVRLAYSVARAVKECLG